MSRGSEVGQFREHSVAGWGYVGEDPPPSRIWTDPKRRGQGSVLIVVVLTPLLSKL